MCSLCAQHDSMTADHLYFVDSLNDSHEEKSSSYLNVGFWLELFGVSGFSE